MMTSNAAAASAAEAAAAAAAAAPGEPQQQQHPAAAAFDPQHEEEDDDETETECLSTDDEQHGSHDGGSSAGGASKKKKKKKKKKKAASADGAPAASGAASSSSSASGDDEAGPSSSSSSSAAAGACQGGESKADKQEQERRFHRALDAAKLGEDMWLLLAGANVHDAKAKRLAEALRGNSALTSVNLSSNHLGDEGVRALVDVLQQGGCSELISLDMRGNSLSPKAEALLADLGKKRKQLAISTGPLPSPEQEGGSSSNSSKPGGGRGGRGRGGRGGRGGAAAASQQQHQQQQQQQQQQFWSDSSLQELAKTSPMFRRYFQMGDEEGGDDSSSGEEEGAQVPQLPPPEEVWGKVSELLPQGVPAIPELSEALVTVSRALDAEMGAMPGREEEAGVEDFQPHFRAVLEHLPQLQQVLALQPAPKAHQSSRQPQPAVGSHRVWCSGILHMLLLHNNEAIDRAVAASGLLPVVLALAWQHDRCSAVQCRAVEMLRCSLQSSVEELWSGLFTAGYGFGLQQQGSDAPVPPLHEAIVASAAATQQQPMGQRPCATGFAVELANTLLQASDANAVAAGEQQLCPPALVALLDGSAAWQAAIAPGGAIHALLQEQDGQLCGPPPPRPAPSVDSMEEDSLEHQLGLLPRGLASNQIMALLSCMGDLGGGGGGAGGGGLGGLTGASAPP